MSRFKNVKEDYNLLTPQDYDELIFDAYNQSLGEETRERIRNQVSNYEYYHGKQHQDEYGNLVDSDHAQQPAGIDYKKTYYATNYFKAIIDRKARWQMGGDQSVHVPREQIDDETERIRDGYEPSPAQQRENDRADNYEEILRQLREENNMQSRSIQAARDRLIANRVVCKIVFNSRTGKLRWIWRPDNEYIPVYSDDDFEELIACHFIRHITYEKKDEDIDAIRKQTFRMNDAGDECYLEEAIYDVNTLELLETIQPEAKLGLDFIPVVEVPVDELLGGELGGGELKQLREQNDILNEMNGDAIDSLKYEMFPVTALFNVPEGTADKIKTAPGALIEANSPSESQEPEMKKIEGGFRWKDSFNDQYNRIKSAMHEISGLPQIVPQELNFGGLNSDTLRVLFHDIISNTEEHWTTWENAFKDLHEKSIKYLQARMSEDNFNYDKAKLRTIDKYDTEMNFSLPLPDNRMDKVELLSSEVMSEFESKRGAMQRLGVDNVQAKMDEIQAEQEINQQQEDPFQEEYGNDDEDDDDTDESEGNDDNPKDDDDGSSSGKTKTVGQEGNRTKLAIKDGKLMGGKRGNEEVALCPTCKGKGRVIRDGELKTCPTCNGKGYVQERKR